jgi:glyoxylase-like metal-dependent hydrolase (beta-lactamase superfamily II)
MVHGDEEVLMEKTVGIFPVKLGLVTAYLLRQDGAILVDTGYPGNGKAILEAMSRNNILPGELRLILLTHGHGDHAGSAAFLRGETGAPVAIHPADAGKLRTGNQGTLTPTGMAGRVMGALVGREEHCRFPAFEPDLLVTDGMNLSSYGLAGTVITTPGHTPGSVSVVLSSKDAFAGDLIRPKIPSGRPGMPFFADDTEQVKQSIRKLMGFHPERIYLGHGGMVRGEAVQVDRW